MLRQLDVVGDSNESTLVLFEHKLRHFSSSVTK